MKTNQQYYEEDLETTPDSADDLGRVLLETGLDVQLNNQCCNFDNE
jgi:hypothetical protein